MILKKRALKAYQKQLELHPLPKHKPINVPVIQIEDTSDETYQEENLYDNWYVLEKKERQKNKREAQYAKYRNLLIADMAFKGILGLALMGAIISILLIP